MKISIIGSGYVGLVTGACLAGRGHDVTCVDIDQTKVDAINHARAPFHEAGLNEILQKHAGKKLKAITSLEAAVLDSEITLIAAPTPFDGKLIDLKYIREISRQIGRALKKKRPGHVVVVKSTVVPGTTTGTVRPLIEEESGLTCGREFGLGMNPEFLSEGTAVEDFMFPDRIVLGGVDEQTQHAMYRMYDSFAGTPFLRTSCAAAEMIKYASNSLQATMISFANEIANLCSANGEVDVVEVMKGVHLMRELQVDGKPARINNFLMAGCGFGGSCFPKDVKALVAQAKTDGVQTPLLQAVLEINAKQPLKLIELLKRGGIESLKDLRVAVLGLAFKPGTDDMRESPSIPIVNELITAGAKVKAFDPIASHEASKVFSGKSLTITATLEEAIADAQAIILVTKWAEFSVLPELLKKHRLSPLVIDGRRMIDPKSVERYQGIGL